MPAIGTKTGKSRQVEKILKKKRKQKAKEFIGPPTPKPQKAKPKKRRPAPVKQPGPVSDSERKAGNTHQQSASYIRDAQKARAARRKVVLRKGVFGGFKKMSADEQQRYSDKEHAQLYDRAGYEEDPKIETERGGYGGNKGKGVKHELSRKVEIQRDALRRVNNSSEATEATRRKIKQGLKNLEAGKDPAPKKAPKTVKDEPRTDAEMRKFLKDGKAPLDRLHIKSTHTSGGTASSGLEVLKNSTRGLHANAEALTGGNWWKGFKHGKKTGSDVLKHFHILDGHKKLQAAGGFVLDMPLSGAGLKTTLRSPARKLEQEANRAEHLGKPEKAAKKREQAKKADTNRGAGIGVSVRVPFSSKGIDKTVGEKTTAKLGKHTTAKVGKRAHDSKAGRAVGKAFVPHYRHPDTPHDVHAADVENQRTKATRDREAVRAGEARGEAYDRAVPPTERENFLRAAERQPKEPVAKVKTSRRKTPEHRAVRAAERKVVSNRRKMDRQRGFVAKERPIEDKATLREVRKTVDDAIARQHAEAQRGVDDAQEGLKKLDEAARKRGLEAGPATHEEARGFLEAELAKGNAAKGEISGGRFEMPHGADESPRATQLRTLAAHESRLESMRVRLAEAEKNGVKGNGKVNKTGGETVGGLKAQIARTEAAAEKLRTSLDKTATTGTHAAERNAERVTREYHSAISAKKSAGAELRKARIAYRNHFGKDPVTGAKVKGDASALYDDAARESTLERLAQAEDEMAAANARYKVAEGRLRETAERHTAQQARRVVTSKLPGLDRKRPRSLDRLQRLEANDMANRAELSAARRAAVGKPKTTGVKVVADEGPDKGRPLADVLKERPRHESHELSNQQTLDAVEQWKRERGQLLEEQQHAGRDIDGLPDYVSHKAPPREGISLRPGRSGRAAKAGHTRHRDDPRDILSQHIEDPGRWDTNVGRVIARTVADSKKAANDVQYLKGLKENVGRPYSGSVKDTEAVFEINPAKGTFRALETRGGKPDAAEITRLKDSGNLVVLPKAIGARELKLRTPVDPSDLTSLGRGWDKVTAWWKSGVTVYNAPFYQERNLYDDTLRFWMGDGDAASYLRAARLVKELVHSEKGQRLVIPKFAPHTTVKIGDRVIPAEQFLKEAIEDGAIRAGHYGGEINEAFRDGERVASRRSPSAKLRNLGQHLEDVPRMASYLAARRRGFSRADAAAWTRAHHFDYTELTDFERGIRRAIPFYTFTSRNLQLQLKKAVSRPGKLAIIQSVREEMAKLAGLDPDWEDKLTEQQRRSLPIPVRVGNDQVKLLYTGMSVSDLNRIWLPGVQTPAEATSQQLDLFTSMFHPIPKAVFELGFNYSLFFRGPIHRTAKEPDAPRYVPAPDGLSKLPKVIQDWLGVKTDRPDPRTGQKITMWPAEIDYIVRLMPQTGFVATMGTPVKNARDQSASDRLIGQATGVRIASLDPGKGRIEEISIRRGEIAAELNDLRDSGGDKYSKSAPLIMSRRKERLLDEDKKLGTELDTLMKRQQRPQQMRIPLSPAEKRKQYREKAKQARKVHASDRMKALRDKQKQIREVLHTERSK